MKDKSNTSQEQNSRPYPYQNVRLRKKVQKAHEARRAHEKRMADKQK